MKTKFTYLLIALITFGVLYAAVKAGQSVGFNESYEPNQPINFSHKIHAGENQIACTYCHFAAEKGRHAGIPPAGLCMNCHDQIRKDAPEIKKVKELIAKKKPIEWIKVHHMADFAYFNHAQHVRVGKVSCQKCHGPVESMTRMRQQNDLSMGWCISCHRESGIAAPKNHKSSGGGDCAKCHY